MVDKMKSNYIQLPPMPSDMPTELIKIIWGYAKMEGQERENFLDFMQKNAKIDAEDDAGEELIKMMEESELKAGSNVEEFHSLMQELIGILIVQACEMSALVYQCYCIDGKSIKEISETIHVPEESIELMAQYYERKMK